VGASLGKRVVDRQRKHRFKCCLERGSVKKPSEKDSGKAKTRTLIRGQFKCLNCQKLGHRKNSLKCPLNRIKKRLFIFFMCIIFNTTIYIIVLITFFMCRKRKPQKNTTKRWFSKNVAMLVLRSRC
jgi:hypothetical protein